MSEKTCMPVWGPYSKKYMVDAYANIAETDMSEAPFWVHGENAETADDYMAQFEVSDFFKNEYLIGVPFPFFSVAFYFYFFNYSYFFPL